MFLDFRPMADGPVPAFTPDGFAVTAIADVYPTGFSDPEIDGGAVRAPVTTPPKSGLFVSGLTTPEVGRVSMGFDGFDVCDPSLMSTGGHVHTNLSTSALDGSGYVLHIVATEVAAAAVASVRIIRDAAGGSATVIGSVDLPDDPATISGIFALGWDADCLTAYRDGAPVLSVRDTTWTPSERTTVSVPLLQDEPAFYGRVSWVHLGTGHFDPDDHPASVTRWAALSARVAALEAP